MIGPIEVPERLKWLASAACGALLFGAVSLLTQLQGDEADPKLTRFAWAGFIIGVAFGAFSGFFWTGAVSKMLERFGVSDHLAVAAGLGVLVVPLTPPIVNALIRRVTRIIGGPET